MSKIWPSIAVLLTTVSLSINAPYVLADDNSNPPSNSCQGCQNCPGCQTNTSTPDNMNNNGDNMDSNTNPDTTNDSGS